MRIMAGLLLVGFVCNALIRPVDTRFTEEYETANNARDRRQSMPIAVSADATSRSDGSAAKVELLLAWTVVGVPLAWGVSQVLKKSLDLFR
jgi:hypothetical protein